MNDYQFIKKRKEDHLSRCLEGDISFEKKTTGFENYEFIHQAIPELNLEEVDTSTTLLNKKLNAPLMISPMVGGTDTAKKINVMLAEIAEELKIAFSVGSQRITKEYKESLETFRVRHVAPSIPIFANIGLVQLNYGFTIQDCKNLVKEIDADALTFHLNPLQEAIQYGGDVNFKDLYKKLKNLCKEVDFPVVVKEVGHGISKETAEKLIDAGVWAIDTAGAGGTSWCKVESLVTKDKIKKRIGKTFAEWGIPTSDSIKYVREVSKDIFLIASGGIRTGLDVSKALALGANLASIGIPVLKHAMESKEQAKEYLKQVMEELRLAMFLTGFGDVEEFRREVSIREQQNQHCELQR